MCMVLVFPAPSLSDLSSMLNSWCMPCLGPLQLVGVLSGTAVSCSFAAFAPSSVFMASVLLLRRFQRAFSQQALANNYRRPVIGYPEDLDKLWRAEVGDLLPDSLSNPSAVHSCSYHRWHVANFNRLKVKWTEVVTHRSTGLK